MDALPSRRVDQLDKAIADLDNALASIRGLPGLDQAAAAMERVRLSLVAERDGERLRAERDRADALEFGRYM